MSDTPRTDEMEFISHRLPNMAVVNADFAAELERELDEQSRLLGISAKLEAKHLTMIDLYRIALEGIADWPHERDETTHIRMAALASHALNHLPRPASADSGENPPPESHRPDGVVAPAGHHF
jgi:hypothetical protein